MPWVGLSAGAAAILVKGTTTDVTAAVLDILDSREV